MSSQWELGRFITTSLDDLLKVVSVLFSCWFTYRILGSPDLPATGTAGGIGDHSRVGRKPPEGVFLPAPAGTVEQDRAQADKVLKDIPVTFPILFDDNNQVSELYDVDAMPVTVLVDRGGEIRFVHRGYKPGYEALYEEQVRQLVKE